MKKVANKTMTTTKTLNTNSIKTASSSRASDRSKKASKKFSAMQKDTKKVATKEMKKSKSVYPKEDQFSFDYLSSKYNLSLPALSIVSTKSPASLAKKKPNPKKSNKCMFAKIAIVAIILTVCAVVAIIIGTKKSSDQTEKSNAPPSEITKIWDRSSPLTMKSSTTSKTNLYPPLPPDDIHQLPNMTKKCQQIGKCWTFYEKYVRQCQFAFCLTMYPKLILAKLASTIKITLDYDRRDVHTIPIEPYTPCKNLEDIGWCLHGTCVIPELDKHKKILEKYNQKRSIDGGWKIVKPNDEKCLDIYKNTTFMDMITDWKYYFTIPELVFRSCTNPLPQLDGKSCFDTANVEHWPLYISRNCSRCKGAIKCSQATVAVNKDDCRFDSSKFKKGMAAETDFRSCCYKVNSTFKPGHCLLGECLPQLG